MLRSVSQLRHCTLQAEDGEIGSVYDVLFDDEFWILRYLVVDTGRWLSGRKVLLIPGVLGEPAWPERRLPVSLTRSQVEGSPDIDSDKPVSRQHETELNDYYGWPTYWAALEPFPITLQPSVPLPPLKGVRIVLESSPLRKSKYSLNALTLACAAVAPMRTRSR